MTSILQQAAARKLTASTETPSPPITETANFSPEVSEEAAPAVAAPDGGYEAFKIKRLITSTGVTVLPVDGYFVPTNQEEYDMLEHFASKGLVVAPAENKKL